MQPPDEPERPAGTPPPAITPNEPAADDDAHPGRIAALREKEKALRERADETWKRVEASRSSNTGVDTAFRVYERDRDRLGPLLSAAIAFRLFLVFVPFVAFWVILAGLFSVDREDLDSVGLGGLTAQTIADVTAQPLWSRILTLLLVAWALLLASRSMIKALRLTYAAAWELGRPRFHSTTKAALVFLGLTTAATVATALARQAREGADAAGWVVTALVVFAVYLGTWLLACLLLPHAGGATWKSMLPGARPVRPRGAGLPPRRRDLAGPPGRQRDGSVRSSRDRDPAARRGLSRRQADRSRGIPERHDVVPSPGREESATPTTT